MVRARRVDGLGASTYMLGMELRGKQLGLVGFGRIGRAVADKAPAFGMRVAYTTPRRRRSCPAPTRMPLDRLLATSDVVSLHVPADAGDAAPDRSERR